MLRHEGCADHYYEDAAAFNALSGFAAVADGVTVSSRSDLFADVLVRHFVQGEFHLELPNEWDNWSTQCTREWRVQATRLYSEMSAEEQQQYDSGSGATFVGVRTDPKHGVCLYGIGDCYALWFDGSRHTGTFPEAFRFNNSPATVDTRQNQNSAKLTVSPLSTLPGNLLALCSDALAEYFLTKQPWKQQENMWRELGAMNDRQFAAWAEGLKSRGEMKDDDYTLLLLHFPPALANEAPPKTVAVEPEPLRAIMPVGSEVRDLASPAEAGKQSAEITSSPDQAHTADPRADKERADEAGMEAVRHALVNNC